jgi:hypothetical protein
VATVYKYKKIKLKDGSTIDEHRLVWINHYGVPPRGYVIHHKDEDPRNNDITNLELKLHSIHSKDHSAKRDVEYLKQYGVAARKYDIENDLYWCQKCKQYLPATSFHKDSRRYTGLQQKCIDCRKSLRKRNGRMNGRQGNEVR